MSLKIIKAGILDTVQDTGRFGFQSQGINTGGAMDRFSAQLANALLGKPMNSPVIELHFPASAIRFEEATVLCITGADFSAEIDKCPLAVGQPVAVNKGSVLTFKKVVGGSRAYLSVLQSFNLQMWLNSYSTNLKAAVGGLDGRALRTGDFLDFPIDESIEHFLAGRNLTKLPWTVKPSEQTATDKIEIIAGCEWNWLSAESKNLLVRSAFTVSTTADRMGYRLSGPELKLQQQKQLVSSGVNFGTVQLLPNGQLIVLMADHQTTGGYPRVANVISAHLPALAQATPNQKIYFKMTDIEQAEQKLLQQNNYLLSVQHASSYKIKDLFL